jgi:hypothetical protein
MSMNTKSMHPFGIHLRLIGVKEEKSASPCDQCSLHSAPALLIINSVLVEKPQLADLGKISLLGRKVSHMLSTTVHHTCKQKWLSFIVMIVASLLPIITTFMGLFTPTTVYGAGLVQHQQTDLGKGINMMIKVKASSMPNPQVNLVVFFTRPLSCTQDSSNCNGDIKLYAPDDKMACSSPIPQAQKSSTANPSWVSNGEECPYLNCNWTSVPGGCSAQTSDTTFVSLQSPIPSLGDTYMSQPLDYKTQSSNDDTDGFSGCIYYGNWPEFPTQNIQLVVSGSAIQLVSGTLPNGTTLQTIQTILASSTKQTLAKGSGSGSGTGWNM